MRGSVVLNKRSNSLNPLTIVQEKAFDTLTAG